MVPSCIVSVFVALVVRDWSCAVECTSFGGGSMDH